MITAATASTGTSPHRVRPDQALRLARRGAGVFAAHGERRRLATTGMLIAFVFGGGRQNASAALTIWRIWPRWSLPALMTLAVAAGTGIGLARLAMIPTVAADIVLGYLLMAGMLRAVPAWTGLPAGARHVGNVASSGPAGTGRALLVAVCADADRARRALTLQVRSDRPKLVALYRGLGFTVLREDGPRQILHRLPRSG